MKQILSLLIILCFDIMMKNNGIIMDSYSETYLKENVCSLVFRLNSLVDKKDNVILNQPPVPAVLQTASSLTD